MSRDKMWSSLTAVAGDEISAAMRELYSIYTPNLVCWLANLYDPAVGGFYYSNSARDNDTVIYKEKEYKLLPDAESTRQALDLLVSSGVMSDYTDLPKKMREEIVDFILSLQAEDGFFYHPQWGREIRLSRRARDFNWCRGILRRFGSTPKYPTVLDSPTEGGGSVVIPEHLSSHERFREYLEGLNITERSYPAGNDLVAEAPQIKALGLMDDCIEYLNKKQFKNSGMWHPVSNYFAVNGLMKISGIYTVASLPMPNADLAAASAIDAITSDEPMGTVVDIYNTWFAIGIILDNLRKCGGEDGQSRADEIQKTLRTMAPEAIRRTKEKISLFKKKDGSFSYCQKYSSEISQGAPVAIYHSEEGDVNGTIIATSGLVGFIYSALGLSDVAVPLFDNSELQKLIEIIDSKR